jgi:formylglycine-generating enzyme required for sulfatase activity
VKDNPAGPGSGRSRVLRGGSWNYLQVSTRAAYRDWFDPGYRGFDLGFRVAAAPVSH